MAYLDGLKHLETLSLIGSSVGDDGMRKIAELRLCGDCICPGRSPRKNSPSYAHDLLKELFVQRKLKDDDLLPIGKIERAVSDFNRLLS